MALRESFQAPDPSVGIPTSQPDVREMPEVALICRRTLGRSRLLGVALLLVLTACPPRGPSTDDVQRSHRELELAAALQQENNIPGAIGHLRLALDLDPDNAEAHLLLAIIQHVTRNNSLLGEEHARRGVEILVDQERHGSTLAEARNILGTILVARGKFDEAVNQLRQSAMDDMNTSPHLAWGNLGLAHLLAGHPQEALEPLHEAVRVQPRFCVGYARLGQAYYELDDMQNAELALVQATDADESCVDNPLMQNAWRMRGEVRAQLGRRNDALEDLERCVALGPQTEDGVACQRLLDQTPIPDSAPLETLEEAP